MAFSDKGIIGPDVSFYQGNPNDNLFTDFVTMRSYRDASGRGVSFIITKAGQRNYPDPAFAYHWRAAKEAKLPRGA